MHQTGKNKKRDKFWLFGGKNTNVLKLLRNRSDFLIKSLGTPSFTSFDQIFLGILLLLLKYIPLEDNTSFLQQVFLFRRGDVPAFPQPLPRLMKKGRPPTNIGKVSSLLGEMLCLYLLKKSSRRLRLYMDKDLYICYMFIT